MRLFIVLLVIAGAGVGIFYAVDDYRSEKLDIVAAESSLDYKQPATADDVQSSSGDEARTGDPGPSGSDFQPNDAASRKTASPDASAPSELTGPTRRGDMAEPIPTRSLPSLAGPLSPGSFQSKESDAAFLALTASLKESQSQVADLTRSAEVSAQHEKSEIARAAREADAMRARFDTAEHSRELLITRLSRLKVERSVLQGRLQNTAAELAARNGLMAAHEGKAGEDLARSREDGNTLRAQLGSLQSGFSAKATELTRVQDQVATSTKRVASLEAQIVRSNEDVRQGQLSLASAMRDKQETINHASAEHLKTDAVQTEQSSKVQSLTKERDDLKTRLTSLDSKQIGTLAEAQRSNDALAFARERIASQGQDVDLLRARIASLGNRNAVLRSGFAASLKRARELHEAMLAGASKAASLETKVAGEEKTQLQLQATLDATIKVSAQRQDRIDALSRTAQTEAQREGTERVRTGAAIDEMKLKLTRLQAQNADSAAATDKLADVTRKTRLLEAASETAREQRKALEKTLAAVTDESAGRERKIAFLTKAAEGAAQRSAPPDASNDATATSDRRQDFARRTADLEGRLKELEGQRKDFEGQLAAVIGDNKEKQARIDALTRTALADGEKQRSERTDAVAALAVSRSKLEALRADVDKSTAESRLHETSVKAARDAQINAVNAKLGAAVGAEQAMKAEASALATRMEALRKDVEGKAATMAALRSDLASTAAEKAANSHAAQAKLDDVNNRLATERTTVKTLSASLAEAEQRLAALPTPSTRSAPLVSNIDPSAGVPPTSVTLTKRPQAGDPIEGRSTLSSPIPQRVERTRSSQDTVVTPAFAGTSARVQSAIARASRLVEQGDISGARLLLEWATKDNSGQAALLLGDTYNPSFLAKLHAIGVRGDLGRANDLYRMAARAGVAEAEQRIQP